MVNVHNYLQMTVRISALSLSHTGKKKHLLVRILSSGLSGLTKKVS